MKTAAPNKLTPQEKAVQIANDINQAASRTQDAVKNLFPIGSRVRIKANTLRGHFRMEVTRHGWGKHDCTTVYGVNTLTQKPRRFYVGTDEVLDVELPAAAQNGGAR
jgi:hypothetical protein